LPILEKSGYIAETTGEIFAKLRAEKLYLLDMDFMFIDKETLATIIKDGVKMSIAGQNFTVPSLNHLIALKLHSIKFNPGIREYRDLPDIINLIRMNGLAVKSGEFRDLCLKYGSESLYHKIMAQLGLERA
jgi:hypothetical protein